MAVQRISAKEKARQSTRAALLDAATRLLFASPGADPIGALRPMDVVRSAVPPRSNGAFYNIWHTQADFRHDLLHHVLSPERSEVGAETAEVAHRLLGAPDFCLAEAFRVVANLNFEGLELDTALQLKSALWPRHSADPDVASLLSELYTGMSAMLVPMYAALLVRSGRRTRAPYTVDHLATALTALAEGLHVRWSVQPSAVPGDLGAPPAADAGRDHAWTLFASIAFTTFIGMTEPVAGPQ